MGFPSGAKNEGVAEEAAARPSAAAVGAALVAAMRPHQWAKNGFLFAPLIFSHNLFEATPLLLAAEAFLLFSLTASSVYLFNDILDLPNDRLHPVKRHRPIASGRLPLSVAWTAALVLACGSLLFSLQLGGAFTAVLCAYLLQNALYSKWLKQLPWVDVTVIAMGFVLRVVAGAVAIGEPPSLWLIVCTFALALYLALGKRKHEILAARLAGSDQAEARRALSGYDLRHLDGSLVAAGALATSSYLLYTLAPENVAQFDYWLAATLPFPAFGIWRFGVLVSRAQRASSPTEALLSDPPFLANLGLWLVTVVAILYSAFSG